MASKGKWEKIEQAWPLLWAGTTEELGFYPKHYTMAAHLKTYEKMEGAKANLPYTI